MAPPVRPLDERLMGKARLGANGCWLWTGNTDKDGYGIMGIRRSSQYRAHRVAYEIFVDEIPAGMFVCHACDTPSCINPEHLFVGSAKDNMKDMWRKGRKIAPKGERHPMAKLTDLQVQQIRELRANGKTLLSIANQFGVTFQHVSLLYRGLSR